MTSLAQPRPAHRSGLSSLGCGAWVQPLGVVTGVQIAVTVIDIPARAE
jgi:hypothetical protein